MKRVLSLLPLLPLLVALGGCPEPPSAEMDLARQALDAARDARASDCATTTFKSALEMLERAKAQIEREEYEEAKTSALAAKNLAEKARREAETNPDCDKNATGDEDGGEPKSDEGDASNVIDAASGTASLFDDPNYELRRINFTYNESSITEEAARTLANNAEWMKRHPKAKVQVEGHCDERGSVEYNLALGERRAQSVRKYMTDLGIEPGRLSVISYGEEQPLEPSATEAAWTRNRRAEFQKR